MTFKDIFLAYTENRIPLITHLTEWQVEALCDEWQGRLGFIYIAKPQMGSLCYKVGMTRKHPEERIRSLNSAGVLNELSLVFFRPADIFLEHLIHQSLRKRFRHKKEFFYAEKNTLERIISEEIETYRVFIMELGKQQSLIGNLADLF